MPHPANQPPSGTGMQGFQHHFPHPDMQYPHFHTSQQMSQSMLPYHQQLEAGYPLYNMASLQRSMQQHQVQFQGVVMQNTASTSSNTKDAEKETISQTDEEAAATALLMSAGAPTRIKVETNKNKNKTPKKETSATSTLSEACQVSPGSRDGTMEKSPEKSDINEHNGDSITREMRQKELASMEDFPSILHDILSGRGSLPLEDISSVMRWMPCGKSWKVDNWQKLGNVLARYSLFSKIRNVAAFSTEAEAWGFQKTCKDGGSAIFQHEVTIQT
eukprot:CAMPEP_0204641520 /NCGR_PEP_ID=MMETSP0717-20131115/51177_1 /ASSEMBLY_ACC=CAM_ASM_000666 /TAXON_ID=230516 /ORGANISM="Chaetoceros curvisetus" /LENGTH=273 /DNA_ID=CAMNT_0051662191 /DNA_START=309 /DNA_END=1130 /DNA_ORIENTATION=-